MAVERRKEGIGGWLAIYVIFLCFTLLIILFGLIVAVALEINPLLENTLGTKNINLWQFILYLIESILILIALITIFKKSKKAIIFNKFLLIVSIILELASLIYVTTTAGFSIDSIDLSIGILLGIVFLIYWNKSIRVKNTFIK